MSEERLEVEKREMILGPYKEPLQKVTEGFGYMGAISLDLEGTKLRPKGLRRPTRHITRKKGGLKGLPAWLKAIPEGRHGSGTLQKRLWRLTSDYCRIRDWLRYGECIATEQRMKDWNSGQGGHYRSYTSCNGMFKFDPINIHLQTAKSNSWPTSQTWETFATNLRQRYGSEIIDFIDAVNRNTPLKITTELVMADIERKVEMIKTLSHYPPYFPRLLKLKELTSTNINNK